MSEDFSAKIRDFLASSEIAQKVQDPKIHEMIRDGFTDEVEYVAESSLGARTGDDGRFVDGALLITPGEAYATDAELVAVDVGLSKGVHDFVGRTYLFEWDGEQWINVSADSVGITVTSAVS